MPPLILSDPVMRRHSAGTIPSQVVSLTCTLPLHHGAGGLVILSLGPGVPTAPSPLPLLVHGWPCLMLIPLHRIGLSQLEGFRRQLLDVLQRSTKPKVSSH